jgi:hypothetical protein
LGSGSIAPPYLSLALDRGERSASRPCRLEKSLTLARNGTLHTQPTMQLVSEAVSPVAKQQRREADHSSPHTVDVKTDEAMLPRPYVSSWSSA